MDTAQRRTDPVEDVLRGGASNASQRRRDLAFHTVRCPGASTSGSGSSWSSEVSWGRTGQSPPVLQTTGSWSNRKPRSRAASLRWSSDLRSPLPKWEPGTELHSGRAPKSKPVRLPTASSPRNVTSFASQRAPAAAFLFPSLEDYLHPWNRDVGKSDSSVSCQLQLTHRGNGFLSFGVTVSLHSYHASIILLQGMWCYK